MHLTAQRVQVAATASQVPLVLGGDCTVGSGTVAGMLAAASGRISLIHFDLKTPRSVPVGALDWMGMAHLLDAPDALPELRQIGSRNPLLTLEQVVNVGHSHAHDTPGSGRLSPAAACAPCRSRRWPTRRKPPLSLPWRSFRMSNTC